MSTDPEPDTTPGRVPRWVLAAPFLGRPPPLTALQWRVLGLVSAVSFFEQYDLYLFSLNLAHIQRDLGIDDAGLGFLGSFVRAGSLLAIVFALAADRVGRRRMLLWTVLGYTLLTGATALAPNAETFVVLQFFARGFATAETLLAAVVIIEEFAPRHRGWGIGAMAAIQSAGAGMAAVVFGFVEVLPGGWRGMYALGLAPLLIIAWWRRGMPETRRFRRLQAERELDADPVSALQNLGDLLRRYPQRVTVVAAMVFLFSAAAASPAFFAPKYLQEVHGWSPPAVAMLNFVGGAFAIIGNPLAGWLSDRFGRRRICSLFVTGFMLAAAGFYMAIGLLLPALWMLLIFFVMGTDVTMTAVGVELFPTSKRATAAGARSVIGTLGSVTGFAAVSVLFGVLGSNWSAIVVVTGAALIVPALVWLFVPETAGRSLEDIAAEPPRSSQGIRG